MIPSAASAFAVSGQVYQRGLVIDSQPEADLLAVAVSVSKGIGD